MKAVKVIACWFGDRRAFPANAIECLTMLRFIWSIESRLDYGLPFDLLLVINRPLPGDKVSSQRTYDTCLAFARSLDGKPIPQGVVRVLERDNMGISFGAFDHGHNAYRGRYDFWWFTEDDQITIDGVAVLADALQQLAAGSGYVATVGVTQENYPPHVHGGCGITTGAILERVREANSSAVLNRGHLPFWWHREHGVPPGHEVMGEIRFTNAIHQLGYSLTDSAVDAASVSWGHKTPRNRRLRPWTEEMAHAGT